MNRTHHRRGKDLRISAGSLILIVAYVLGAPPALAAVTATVCLYDSTGGPLSGAQAHYRAGGSWVLIGSTDGTGCVSSESPGAAANRDYRVTYNGQTQQKTQDTTINPVVTFNTILVSGELIDSTGTGIPGALIEYRAGSWLTLGTTDANGQTSAEMLAANRNFRVTYNGQTQQKTQDAAVDPLVGFQTGKVLQGTGARVLRYRASGWQTFVDGIELLPLNVSFDLDVGPDETHTPIAGDMIYVPAAPTAPVVDAGMDLGSDEGSQVSLIGAYTDLEVSQTHAATIDWGDGSTVEPVVVTALDGLGGSLAAQHGFVDDGLYIVEVCVTDNGNPDATGCDGVEITVANLAPTVAITGLQDTEVGLTIGLGSDVTDPGLNDVMGYAWVITQEGQVVATGDDPTLDFLPAGPGEHQVQLTVNDGDGGISVVEATFNATASPEPVDPPDDPEPPADPPDDPVEEPVDEPQAEIDDDPAEPGEETGPEAAGTEDESLEPLGRPILDTEPVFLAGADLDDTDASGEMPDNDAPATEDGSKLVPVTAEQESEDGVDWVMPLMGAISGVSLLVFGGRKLLRG